MIDQNLDHLVTKVVLMVGFTETSLYCLTTTCLPQYEDVRFEFLSRGTYWKARVLQFTFFIFGYFVENLQILDLVFHILAKNNRNLWTYSLVLFSYFASCSLLSIILNLYKKNHHYHQHLFLHHHFLILLLLIVILDLSCHLLFPSSSSTTTTDSGDKMFMIVIFLICFFFFSFICYFC